MGYSDIKEMLKDARNFASGANDIQTVNLLKDIQIQVYDLLEENRELREENHALKNEKILEGDLIYKNSAYYKVDNDEIPYCSKCFDVDKTLVTMNMTVPAMSTYYKFSCPNCKNKFDSKIPHNQDTTIRF